MAIYTLELREIVENYKIFDFYYPIFDEEYRLTFERKFIEHFYFREIGCETVARFKFNLRSTLNLIMPFYNKLYISQLNNVLNLNNYEVTETFEKSSNGTRKGTSDVSNKNMFSDTGRKRVDINDIDYISNISKEENKTSSNVNDTNQEEWVRTMKGNIGVQTQADLIRIHENSLKNVDKMVFDELEILFMGVF